MNILNLNQTISQPTPRPAYQLSLESSWSSLKTAQCSQSSAYCWMDCLELPTSCLLQSSLLCINSESKPCCTDIITENCEAHDPNCHWECVQTYLPINDTTGGNKTTDDKFCNGYGTDMYMQGFTVSRPR